MDAHCSDGGSEASGEQRATSGELGEIGHVEADFVRRLTIVVILGFLFVAAFVYLNRLYSGKFFDVTRGKAEWIWPRVELSREAPVAFFAARDFDLPANRYYTKIKVAGDPEYTLYFNGNRIGGRRVGDKQALDVFDVSALSKTGQNRIVVAVRSVTGVGGLLVTVDLSPETVNFVVSDRSWSIFHKWDPLLLRFDMPDADVPAAIGKPPIGRWNYLATADTGLEQPAASTVIARQPCAFFSELPAQLRDKSGARAAGQACSYATEVPETKEVSGVAIVGRRPVRAAAFDFGPTGGRLRLTRTGDVSQPEVFDVRFGNTPGEMVELEGDRKPFVFAAGERSVEDPDTRNFRFARVSRRITPSRPPQDISFKSRLMHAITGAPLRKAKGPLVARDATAEVNAIAEVLR